jgi:hypothetical protein
MAEHIARKLPDLKPLKLSCTRTDCDNELHCYRQSKKKAAHPAGACQSCGAELVDWPRVQQRDLQDVAHTLESLKTECVRHDFWHIEIEQYALNYALRKGREGLEDAVRNRIRKSIGTKSSHDGVQTPMPGEGKNSKANLVHYAQHATASCCRRCVEYWHGIPPDQQLTEEQIEYFARLCLMYIDERVPDLPAKKQKVPPIRGNT